MSKNTHAIEMGFQQALRLHRAGRLAEAEQFYRQILAAVPNHADSLHMLGVLALQSGRPAEALPYLEQGHRKRQPRMADLSREPCQRLARLREILRQRSRNARRHCGSSATAPRLARRWGSCLVRSPVSMRTQSQPIGRRSRHGPNLPDLHNNLGLALREAGHLEAAAEALRRAVANAPRDGYGRGNLAGVLKELGRLDEAEALHRDALRQQPDDPMHHYGLGLCLLLAGRLAEGWAPPVTNGASGRARCTCRRPRGHCGRANRWPGAPC